MKDHWRYKEENSRALDETKKQKNWDMNYLPSDDEKDGLPFRLKYLCFPSIFNITFQKCWSRKCWDIAINIPHEEPRHFEKNTSEGFNRKNLSLTVVKSGWNVYMCIIIFFLVLGMFLCLWKVDQLVPIVVSRVTW